MWWGRSQLFLEALSSYPPELPTSILPHPIQDWLSQVERRGPGEVATWVPWDVWAMGMDHRSWGVKENKAEFQLPPQGATSAGC